MMAEFLNHLSCWDWLSLAAFVFIVDLIFATGILIWIAVAALLLGVLLALIPEVSWEVQLFLLGVFSVGAGVIGQSVLKRLPRRISEQRLNCPEANLVGRHFEVCSEIKNGVGRVRAGDGVWPASGPDISAGEMVKVIRVEAMRLIVEPIPKP